MRYVIITCCLLAAFTLSAQRTGKLTERAKAPEEKVDFEYQTFEEPDNGKPNMYKDRFVVFFDEERFPSFLKHLQKEDKQYENREEKLEAYSAYDKEMREQIREAIKEIFDEKQIEEIYTGAFTGLALREIGEDRMMEAEKQLREREVIIFFANDFRVYATDLGTTEAVVAPQAQSTPWGTSYTGSARAPRGKWAFVLDTGVDLDHPDLNVNTSAARNYSGSRGNADDKRGHGTHVAGTIGAKDNNFGTKGVAHGATIVPVKVLDDNGNGPWSHVLKGLDYVAAASIRGDVANLSLGAKGTPGRWDRFWNTDKNKINGAIRNLGSSGVYVTISAGNDASQAKDYWPAAINGTNVYTISSMTSGYNLSSFSNYGNGPVDYAAPGSSILSTHKGGGYAYKNGTSMAAPHVAGILLINNGRINSSRRLSSDKDRTKDRVAKK